MNNGNNGKSIKKGRGLRSPLAKARDDFFENGEGKRLMGDGFAYGCYLKNRLENAFIAGWYAHEEYLSKVVQRNLMGESNGHENR